MSLPSTGPISLFDIQNEFGGGAPMAIDEYYRGGGLVPSTTPTGVGSTGQISTSGSINFGMFRGTVRMAAAGSQTFSAPGSYSFTVPQGYSELNVVTVGGGGGGGGHQSGGDPHQGGIGGSGGYVRGTINVTGGETLTVVVGSAGYRATSQGFPNGNNTAYQGGRGGSSYIYRQSTSSVYQSTVATGGYGGGRSGDGDHGDKGTFEDWAIDGYQPQYMWGNGRSGFPNGFDYYSTAVNQSRNVGRSGMNCPTGFDADPLSFANPALGFGTGGEGCSGDNSFPPQDGTGGIVIIHWGEPNLITTNRWPIRGLITSRDLSIYGNNLYGADSASDFSMIMNLRAHAYGGTVEGYAANGSTVNMRIDTWSVTMYDYAGNQIPASYTFTPASGADVQCVLNVPAMPSVTVVINAWAREQPIAFETAILQGTFAITNSAFNGGGFTSNN